ncbi:MAG: 50S ribosomal protein L3 N(5)-glutamine methyltransferase [Burkholderiales bacterium]
MSAARPLPYRTLRDLLRHAVSRMIEAKVSFGHGTGNAYDEAAWLLLSTLHLPPDLLDPFLDARLTDEEITGVLKMIDRRTRDRVPTAYLTGEAWLGEHRFRVDSRVIVPRSFIAELLRERMAPWVATPDTARTILDLCTGSGCLAILAALAFPDARVDAADISADALQVARANVDDYGLSSRVTLIESDLFSSLSDRGYDLILCNPPYVDANSMAALPPEYRAEPALALAAGADGLDIVRRLLGEARSHLSPHGRLVVEIGHNRAALEAAYPQTPFLWTEVAAGGDFVFTLEAADLP